MWAFNKNIDYINGAVCAVIYDRNNEKLYHISASAKEFISKLIFEHKNIEDYKNNPHFQTLINFNLIADITSPEAAANIDQPELKLDYVWIEVTNKCNLKCIHCYDAASSENSTMVLLYFAN